MTAEGFVRHRGALDATMILLVSIAAVVTWAVHETRTTGLLGAAAILAGVLVAVWPREPLPTVCLLVLMGDFAAVVSRLSPTERTMLTPLLAFLLYGIHANAALLGSIPRGTEIERRLVRRYAWRSGSIALGGAVVALAMEGLASGSRPSWAVFASLAAGIGLAIALLIPLQRRRTEVEER